MRRVPVLLSALAAGALVVPAGAALAQRAPAAPAAPTTLTLSKPDVEYEEPFTFIAGVRELRDGRVIVADRQEKTIQLIDLASGNATKIGREGSGPNEYGMIGDVYPMPGDSTLMFDVGNMRYLVIAPNGTVARTFSTMDPENPDMRLFSPRATDLAGNLYFLDRGLRGPGAGGPPMESPDSGTVLRYELATRKVTPVGKVALPKSTTTSGGSGNQRSFMMVNVPFSAQDDWTVGIDGRIGIVRHDPYRVEWLAPTGQRVVGPAVAYQKVRVTDKDKENVRNARMNPVGSMRVTIGGGGGAGGGGSSAPPTTMRPPEPTEWPEFKPPFSGNASMVGPDGRLWVLRNRSADDPVPSYDVFDAFGRLATVVKLPPRSRLIGFGSRSAYVVRTDEDDLQYLQRYKLF